MYKMRKEKGFKTFLVMIHKPATLSLPRASKMLYVSKASVRFLSVSENNGTF